jgi:AcrR family transcriptional regulator
MTGVGIRARKKAASRERILREAIALFAGRGIEAVTVDEIAAAADVGKGTVYNYFAAKEDIIVAFLLDVDREPLAAMPALAESSASAADALDAAAWSLLANKEAHHRFVRVFLGRLASA